MSKKKRKVVMVDDDWMGQLDTMAKNSKNPGGNKHLFKLSSYPAELLRDGTSIKWKEFSFKIHEVGPKEERYITIVENGVDGANPVKARLGTQPMALLQSQNLDNVVLHTKEYSITDLDGRPQLLLWRMLTTKMIKDMKAEEKRWAMALIKIGNVRQAKQKRMPLVKVRRKKKK